MKMDRDDRRSLRPISAPSKNRDPRLSGSDARDNPSFRSSEDENDWHRSAYRQVVNHKGWQRQAPVDEKLQATFDAMPELAAGQYFRGPDGRHRQIGPEQRESAEIDQVRRNAFAMLTGAGTTWADLENYSSSQPHPGEDEAVKLMRGETRVPTERSAKTERLKQREMGAAPEFPQSSLGPVSDGNLDFGDAQEAWGGRKKKSFLPPVLVAGNDRVNVASALPKGTVTEPKFTHPGPPIPGLRQRRDFIQDLIGRPANDNTKSPIIGARPSAPHIDSAKPVANPGSGSASQVETDPAFEVANPLFNWRRDGKPQPAPAEFAVYAASDEGRFSYLEDMKDEWSRLLNDHPNEVFQSMVGEVEKLSIAAQRDFLSSFHRQANPAEIAEINDAIEKVVFAPAERWSMEQVKPNETKSYLGLPEGPPASINEALAIVGDIVDAAMEASKRPGKLGNETTQRHVPMLAQKILDELKRCGVQQSNDPIKYEKQIKTTSSNKGARWSDFRIEFSVGGKIYALDVNHSAYLSSRYSRTRGEQAAFDDIVSFRQINANGGGIPDHEGAAISFPKIRKKQTEEEYVKQMQDFVKNLIDCKSPVKVRVTNPYDVKIIRRNSREPVNDG